MISENDRLRCRLAAAEREWDRLLLRIESTEAVDGRFTNTITEFDVLEAAAACAQQHFPDADVRAFLGVEGETRVRSYFELSGGQLRPLASLEEPVNCLALELDRPVCAEDSDEPAACEHSTLADWPAAMACIPIPGARRPAGVLHISTAPGDGLSVDQLAVGQAIANRLGQRLAALRSSLLAPVRAMDSRNHLLGRVEAMVLMNDMFAQPEVAAVAVCEVDRWDTWSKSVSSEEARKSLELITEALLSSVRPGDVVIRASATRFLIAFPSCAMSDAQRAMERVRETLALKQCETERVRLTISAGLADNSENDRFEEVLLAAEAALGKAQRSGGNRAYSGEPALGGA